jgi:hypothetical protein
LVLYGIPVVVETCFWTERATLNYDSVRKRIFARVIAAIASLTMGSLSLAEEAVDLVLSCFVGRSGPADIDEREKHS